MDPFSLVAGSIAILQAGDRLTQLIRKIEEFSNAEVNIKSLHTEVVNLKTMLDELQQTAQTTNIATLSKSTALSKSVEVSVYHINRLQSVVSKFLPRAKDHDGDLRTPRTLRLAWLRKRNQVELLRQALRDSLFAVQMNLLSLSL